MSEQEQEQPKQEKVGRKLSPKVIIIAVVAIIVVVNLFIVGRVILGRKHPPKKEVVVEEVGPKVTLEEFLVNLSDSNEHYLKTTIALGLKKDLTEEKVKEDIAPIRDAIVMVLSSKKMDELNSEDGKTKLKKELVERINGALGGEKVVKVYFVSFATQ